MTDGLTKYERIEKSLKGLPMAWYPALLETVIRQGYEAGTWVDEGASCMARRVEARIDHSRGLVPPGGKAQIIHFEKLTTMKDGDWIQPRYGMDGSIRLVLYRKDGTEEDIKIVGSFPASSGVFDLDQNAFVLDESTRVKGAFISRPGDRDPSPGEGESPSTDSERHG